ncbi:MAG TPA: VOC family protein [Bauldia sp.]|nr:VOC family protein [Bauldia sp.]
MQKIMTCLWFDGHIEEAARFYASVFPDAKVKDIAYYGEGAPMPKGTPLTAIFEIAGQEFMLLNGGPIFKPSEAASLYVHCKDQKEVDTYWAKLTADGGAESMCGWLKDKYGVSWQIVPEALERYMKDKDAARANRVMQAMLQMRKIDVAALDRAYAA